MTETLEILHERIDDVPLIIGVAQRLNMDQILNRHLGTHGLQAGLNNGQLGVGWLGHILSQGDHRKVTVRGWANDLRHTLEGLLGQAIREVDFSDDRLGNLLRRLSDDAAWLGIERDLWAATAVVYELPVAEVRIDTTTSYGYHQPTEDGLLQYGTHSKDHRPDLPQLKLVAAAAEPSGHLISADVVAGQRADDPLYVPMMRRVRQVVGRSGLLYAGDAKMAALATRAHVVYHQDYYLVPLPLTGQTGQQFDAWVERVVAGEQAATLVWDGARLLGGGYEFERRQQATVNDQVVAWTERVQLFRSRSLADKQTKALAEQLTRAEAELYALTPEPGRGRQQIRDEATLPPAVNHILEKRGIAGLLQVTWQREESEVIRYCGPGRPGPNRPGYTETQVRYVITAVQPDEAALAARRRRLGWRLQATNAPTTRLSLAQSVLHYRQGWCLERDFHLVKDRPLGLSPLFVWKDDQIKGLARLLTLALRLLTLIESQVRRGLASDGESMAGLYEGNPNRTTDRPTGTRLLKAFARAKITLSRVVIGADVHWHVTPLTPLHKQILRYLRLPDSLYAQLAPP